MAEISARVLVMMAIQVLVCVTGPLFQVRLEDRCLSGVEISFVQKWFKVVEEEVIPLSILTM